MTVGPPRVGKTFLRHLLLGLPPPKDSASTAVMETADMVSLPKSTVKTIKTETFVALDEKKEWVLLKRTSAIESLLMILHEREARREINRKQFKVASQAKQERSKEVDSQAVTHIVDPHLEVSPSVSRSDEVVDSMDYQATDVSFVNEVTSNTVTPGTTPHRYQRPDPIIDEIVHLLQTEKNYDSINLQEAHLLQFIDCGGQLAYHDILPIFVNLPAIYLHVFNLTMGLKAFPKDEIRFQDGLDCYLATSPLNVEQMMTRSMMTIHALTHKRVSLPEEVKAEGSPEPCIAFIGTHYDKFCTDNKQETDKKLKDISTELDESTRPMSSCLKVIKHQQPGLPAMFFPVNNLMELGHESQDMDLSVRSIKCLKRRLEEVPGVEVTVPIKWYLFQLISQDRQNRYCQYQELYKYCADHGISKDAGDFYAMVTYFNALGLLTHLCGPDKSKQHIEHAEKCDCLVFTDPSHLFQNVTKLYQVQFLGKGHFTGDRLKLKEKGVLTMTALDELGVDVDKSCFMEILVQLFIGAKMDEDKTLFVPSVLTNPTNPTTSRDVDANGLYLHCFAIAFLDTVVIPCGVFTGMTARLQSKKGWKVCFGSISRMHMEFKVDLQGHVHVLDHTAYIEVTVDEYCNFEMCRNAIIEATAESYCFLFHTTDTQSGTETCEKCRESPYLLLGKTCEHCSKNFAELKLDENCVPTFTSCMKDCHAKRLCDDKHRTPFQKLVHKVS